jgi:hypothetical protein
MLKRNVIAMGIMAFALVYTARAENTGPMPVPSLEEFTGAVAKAHGAASFGADSLISFRIVADRSGSKIMDGEIIASPDLKQVRYEGVNGTTVVCDGPQTYISPEGASFPHKPDYLRLWPLLATAPYQLNRDYVKITPEKERALEGILQHTARLTFVPENRSMEWALLYKNADSVLSGFAYKPLSIAPNVTEATTPTMVVFRRNEQLGDLLIPSVLEFYAWDEEKGITGERIGSATITEVQFLNKDVWRFDPPKGKAVTEN